MDDEALFGPEFHRLGFGEAVSKGCSPTTRSSSWRSTRSRCSRAFQTAARGRQLRAAARRRRQDHRLLERPGEAGRSPGTDFGADDTPMKRAVAFAGSIANSQKFARMFSAVVERLHRRARSSDDDDETTRSRCGARSSTSTAPSTRW